MGAITAQDLKQHGGKCVQVVYAQKTWDNQDRIRVAEGILGTRPRADGSRVRFTLNGESYCERVHSVSVVFVPSGIVPKAVCTTCARYGPEMAVALGKGIPATHLTHRHPCGFCGQKPTCEVPYTMLGLTSAAEVERHFAQEAIGREMTAMFARVVLVAVKRSHSAKYGIFEATFQGEGGVTVMAWSDRALSHVWWEGDHSADDIKNALHSGKVWVEHRQVWSWDIRSEQGSTI